MKSKEAVDQAFEYAKIAEMKMIVGVPNHELLVYVEQKVKAYDIKLAIHNHGTGDRGVIDFKAFLQTISKLGYEGTLALEYETDENDPLPEMAESIGYVKGILAITFFKPQKIYIFADLINMGP